MSEANGGSTTQAGGDGSSTTTDGGGQQAATPRMLRVMWEGKETEMPEADVVGQMRKGRESAKILTEAQKRREEGFRAKAEADGVLARLKKGGADARAALRELGVDPAKVGEEEILEMIRQEKMTPEERKRHELEQRLKGFEDEKKKSEEDKKSAARETEKQRHMDELGGLFVEALAKTGLPRAAAPVLFPRMAALYQQNEEAGYESSAEEMAHHAMEGLRELQTATVGRLKGDELLQYLGPAVVKEVLTANLARNHSGTTPGVPRSSGARPSAKPAVGRPPSRTGADYLRRLSEGILD